jgi:hypothetical protein
VPAVLESLREAKQVGQLRARIVELETALAVQTARAEERQALLGTLQALLPRWRWQGPVPGSPYANTFSSAFCVTFGAASPVTARST